MTEHKDDSLETLLAFIIILVSVVVFVLGYIWVFISILTD